MCSTTATGAVGGRSCKWEPSFLPVFAPKALAGLGVLPDTVASRSIRIELKRRAPGEHVERFRRRRAESEAEPLREALASCCEQLIEQLSEARPDLPDELGDRAQDVWEPLLAIADLAGHDWPERARRAAVELSSAQEVEDESAGVQLLAGIHRIFNERRVDRLSTTELLDALCADDEAPWGDWHGRPLSARSLAKLLRRFKVRPRTVRFDDGTTAKGYLEEQFEDSFIRYLGLVSVTSVTTAPLSQERAISDPSQDASVTDSEEGSNPHGYQDVTHVTVRDGGKGEERQ